MTSLSSDLSEVFAIIPADVLLPSSVEESSHGRRTAPHGTVARQLWSHAGHFPGTTGSFSQALRDQIVPYVQPKPAMLRERSVIASQNLVVTTRTRPQVEVDTSAESNHIAPIPCTQSLCQL